MVLNNVTKFHKILIKNIEDIMVLNNVTKFHKILIKIFDLESGRRRDRRTYGLTDRVNT